MGKWPFFHHHVQVAKKSPCFTVKVQAPNRPRRRAGRDVQRLRRWPGARGEGRADGAGTAAAGRDHAVPAVHDLCTGASEESALEREIVRGIPNSWMVSFMETPFMDDNIRGIF